MTTEEERAESLPDEARRLYEAGRPTDALTVMTEAVEARRRLTSADVGTYRELAHALHIHSALLHATGDTGAALIAVDVAIGLDRIVAAARADLFLSQLVSELLYRSLLLAELARYDEAVASGFEAIGLVVCTGDPRSLAESGTELARRYVSLREASGRSLDPQVEAQLSELLVASGAVVADEGSGEGSDELDRLHALEAEHRARDEVDQALDVLDRMLEIDPSFSPALNNKGALLTGLNRFYEAIPLLKAALEADPTNAVAHNNLAMCLAGTGRHEQALRHLQAAWDGGYQHAGVIYNAAFAEFQLGRLGEGIASMANGLDGSPDPAQTVSFLNQLAQVLGVPQNQDVGVLARDLGVAVDALDDDDVVPAEVVAGDLTVRVRVGGQWREVALR